MDAGEAMHVYSILSIGDALIGQIPALLIALGAGIITTRVNNDNKEEGEETNIGRDIAAELFAEPKALLTTAAIVLLFGLVPGMPSAVFVVLAAGLGIAGVTGLLKPLADAEMRREAEEQERKNARIVDLTNFSATTPFILRLPESLRNTVEAETIRTAVRVMRNGMLERRGIPDIKPVELEYSQAMPVDRAHFLMAEVPLVDDEIMLGWGPPASRWSGCRSWVSRRSSATSRVRAGAASGSRWTTRPGCPRLVSNASAGKSCSPPT